MDLLINLVNRAMHSFELNKHVHNSTLIKPFRLEWIDMGTR